LIFSSLVSGGQSPPPSVNSIILQAGAKDSMKRSITVSSLPTITDRTIGGRVEFTGGEKAAVSDLKEAMEEEVID
jgi:hypothetical protein